MISSIKTAMIAGVLAVGAALTLVPVSAEAAPRNGYGLVYPPSDCSAYQVRVYAWGGDASGSACGYWLDEWRRDTLWNYGDRNHNYTNREICELANFYMDPAKYAQSGNGIVDRNSPTCW